MPTLSKKERLRKNSVISTLFKSGSNTFLYPFKVFYLKKTTPSSIPPKIVWSVSKRNFKKAVDRNWVKRRMREVYRLQKHQLQKDEEHEMAYMAIVYVAKEKIPFHEQRKKISRLFKRFQ